MLNYPDDIRSYDHDPRSPFYVDASDENDSLVHDLEALAAWVITLSPCLIHSSIPKFKKRLRDIISEYDLNGEYSENQLSDMSLEGNDHWHVLAYMHDAIAEVPISENDCVNLKPLGAHMDRFKAPAKPLSEA